MENTTYAHSEPRAANSVISENLLPGRFNYWYSIYFPCAIACLNVVLRHSETGRKAYSEIVELWNDPKCDAFLNKLLANAEEELTMRTAASLDALRVFSNDPAANLIRAHIGTFVEKHFNPTRRTPKITTIKARYLCRVILMRSMSDALEISPELMERWPTQELEEVMGHGTPTRGRGKHSQVQAKLRSMGFNPRHNDTIMRWAEIWFLARIQPGKIADALNELAGGEHPNLWNADKFEGIDDKYIRDGIRDYDIATGRKIGLD